jgi:hypothetical protein
MFRREEMFYDKIFPKSRNNKNYKKMKHHHLKVYELLDLLNALWLWPDKICGICCSGAQKESLKIR